MVDIEKYENLSHKLGMKFKESPTKPYIVRKEYWGNHHDRVWKAIDRVVPSLVGKGWDEAYSILTKVFNNYNTDMDKRQVISASIYTFTRSGAGKLILVGRWRRQEEYDSIEAFIKHYQKPSFYKNQIYYVHPETNKVCVVESKRQRPRHSYKESRKIQERMARSKKADRARKKEKERVETSLVAMINKQDLYKFYLQLLGKRRALLDKMNKQPSEYPKIKLKERVQDYNTPGRYRWYSYKLVDIPYHKALAKLNQDIKWWTYMEKNRVREAEEAKRQLPGIQKQITDLEEGRYDVYFESNVYLYSIQKECHHVATP